MPKYHLRNDWFAPDGNFYKKGLRDHPTEIPESLVEHLPKTAQKAMPWNSKPVKVTPVPPRKTTLIGRLLNHEPKTAAEADPERAIAEIEDATVNEQTSGAPVIRPPAKETPDERMARLRAARANAEANASGAAKKGRK